MGLHTGWCGRIQHVAIGMCLTSSTVNTKYPNSVKSCTWYYLKILRKIYFEIILDLFKSFKESRDLLYTLIQLSLMLTSYITMRHLSKLRNYIKTILLTKLKTRFGFLLVCPLMPVFGCRTKSRNHTALSSILFWGQGEVTFSIRGVILSSFVSYPEHSLAN